MIELKAEIDIGAVINGLHKVARNLDRNLILALELGADLVGAEAKANHRYTDRTGALTNSIAAEPARGRFTSGNLDVNIGAGAPHAQFVEFGASPHRIVPRFRKALRIPIEGGFVFRRAVNHPGNDPYRFLAEALERKTPEVVRVLEDAVELSFAQAGFEV